MNDLKSLSLELSEFIQKSSTENRNQQFKKHIQAVNNLSSLPSVTIPDGLTWFGVTESLTPQHTRGKIIVLDFFTYCCMNCIHILPHLKKLETKYAHQHGLAVIGVHSPKFDNEKDDLGLQNAVVKLDITHPVVNDINTVLWNDLDIICWPTLLILDPTGKPIFVLAGEGHENELNWFIEAALEFYGPILNQTALPLCQTKLPVAARFLSYPGCVTGRKQLLAVSDSGHHRVLLIRLSGEVEEVIGGPSAGNRDGSFTDARFRDPQGVVFHGDEKLYVADCGNHLIRMIDLRGRNVVTVVGTGEQGCDLEGGKSGLEQAICSPWGLCIVPAPSQEIPMSCGPKPIVPLAGGCVGPPPPPPPPMAATRTVTKSAPCDVLLIAMSGCHQIWAYFFEDTYWWKARLYGRGTCAAVVGSGEEKNRNNRFPMLVGLAQPSGLTYAPEFDAVFIADSESSSVRKLSLLTGGVEGVVGGHASPDNLFSYGDVDGEGRLAQLQHPLDVAWDPTSQCVFIADSYNHKLKKVHVQTLKCCTCPVRIRFNEPGGVHVDETAIYVADTNSHSLFRIDRNDWAIAEIELKLRSSHCGKSRIRVVWETSVPIASSGSDVILKISLDASASGQWRVAADCPDTIKCSQISGVIEDGKMEIRFFTSTQDEAAFELDLAICRAEACHLRYYRLLVHPNRSETAEKTSIASFSPQIEKL